MSTTETEYQLVFEGAIDDSADTLRKVKGVLIADCDLSIPEVQNILSTTPAVLKRTASEAELTVLKNKLTAAGARVLIVKPKTQAEERPTDEFEAVFELDEEDLGIKPKIAKGDGGVINIAESTESLDEILGAMNIQKGEEIPEVPSLDLVKPHSDAAPAAPLFEFQTAAEPVIKEAQADAKSALLELSSALQIADEPELDSKSILNPPTLKEPEVDLSIKLDEPVPPTNLTAKPETSPPIPQPEPPKKPAAPTPGKLAEKVFPKAEQPKKPAAPTAIEPPPSAPAEAVRESHAVTLDRGRFLISKFRVSPSLDLLLPILIGLAILWIGNSMYLSSGDQKGDEELIRSLERLVATDPKAEKEEKLVSGDKTFTGSSSTEYESATASITINGDKLRRISLEISTPEPPRLTAQQLVRNEVRAPWARKIETRGLDIEQKPDGSISADGVAKIYVSYKGEMLRAIGTVEVSGRVDTVDHRVVLNVTVKVGEPDSLDRTNIAIDPTGKIRFFSFSRVVVTTREIR